MTTSAIEYLKQTKDTIEHIFNAINIEEAKINDLSKELLLNLKV